MPGKYQEFKTNAECPCGNGRRLHYVRDQVNGKQIRRSLKTNDLAIARRRLVEFRAKAERLAEKMSFEAFDTPRVLKLEDGAKAA